MFLKRPMSIVPPDLGIEHPLVQEYARLEERKEELEREIEEVDTQMNIAPNKTAARMREGLAIFHHSHLLEEMVRCKVVVSMNRKI